MYDLTISAPAHLATAASVGWRALLTAMLMTLSLAPGAEAATTGGGSQHTVVVKSDGTVWAWGGNGNGQLGDGTTVTRKSPTQVTGLTGVVAVAAGGFHTLALTSGGAVWAWGWNSDGQLGDGTTTQRLTPIDVGLTSIVAIAAGEGHSVALGSDGAIWIWGRNTNGQLGDGTTTRRLVPQLVLGLSASAIGAGYTHTLAVRTDGTVWSWGGNQYGQLGDGTTTQRTAPVQMNSVSGATAVAAGHSHSLILTSGGSLCATGYNAYGQLGDGTWAQRTSPVPVAGLSSVTALTARYYQSGVTLADGTARTWGYNGYGALGDGTTTNRSTAVQPIGLSGLAGFSFGYFNGVAVTTSGVVLTWGSNSYGQLGDGTTTSRTVPDAISEAGFNWLVSTPAFSVAGGTYYANQTVVVTNATVDAAIYYTLTGDDPTEFDIPIASGASIVIDGSATLKARAFKAGFPPSRVAAATYVLVVTTPTLTPSGGTFTTPQTVSMSTTPADATIRYTTTGENPTELSPIYTGPISVATTTTIRSAAFKAGWTTSGVRLSGFTMNFGTLAAPTISAGSGTYNGPVTVTLTSTTPGAAIRYTTNGTTPQTYSTLYIEPLTVDSTTTLTARAFHVDYTASPSAVATITMVVADPTFTPGEGIYLPGQAITVASATPGATITYTLDETNPAQTGPAIASGAALTVGGYTLKARAWKTGYTPSAIATASYGVSEETVTPLVAAGGEHSLAVRGDGVAWAWGANSWSQLGDGTTTVRPLPVIVSGLTGVKALAGGNGHSLALQLDGRVSAWGAYNYGQLGDGTNTWRHLPVLVSGLTAVAAVAAGQDHSVALREDGTVWTWGLNNNGQLGDGTTTNRSVPVPVPALSGIIAIAAGSNHTLALAGDGTVWSWGANGNGQLGDGTTTTRLQPVPVSGLANVVAIGAGGARSLAVTSNGAASQWGMVATGFQRTSPELIAGLSDVTTVAAGSSHSMALTADGNVWCWGGNSSGQLGDGTLTERASPVPVLNDLAIVSIAAGSSHSLALAADGAVYSWGRNYSGQLGDGLTTNRSTPSAISGAAMHWTLAPPLLSLSTGLYYASQTTIVTHADPNAVLHYTINGADPTAADPVVASGGAIAIDSSLTVKVRASKPGSVTSPVASAAYELKVVQPTLTPSSGVYAGPQDVLASTTTAEASIRVTIDGTDPSEASPPASGPITMSGTGTMKARAWKNGWTPSETTYASYWISEGTVATPTIASGPATTGSALVTLQCNTEGVSIRYTRDGTDPTMASPVYRYAFLVTGTTTIKVRAYRPGFTPSAIASVLLALDDPSAAPTPTITPAGGQFAAGPTVTVQAGGEATIRYTTDGRDPSEADPILTGPVLVDRSLVLKVRAWQDGAPPSAVRRADFVITGALAAGRGHFLGLAGDRRLWAWGDNWTGQIGNGTTSLQYVPVVVLSDVVAVAAAEDHSLAVKADGTVWAWGRNPYGQLGDGTQNAHSTPFRVTGLPPIIAVATGARHSLALTADGTVWAWGSNQAGQLGDGTTTARFVPGPIPHLSGILTIAAGDSFSLAIGSDGARAGVVWSWGLNAAGQLGDGAQANRLVPVRAVGIPSVTALQAGGDWALALAADATVWSWGANTYGQLGDGSKTLCAVPRRVEALRGIRGIAAGRWHALVTDGRHALFSWGNTGEHLGLPSEFYTSATVPQALRDVNVTFPAALSAGVSRSILARSDGSVWAFGSAPLGDGTMNASRIPVSVSGLCLADNAWLAADTDGDGLTTWEEWLLGTDPLDADSNSNGVPDGLEPAEQGAGANADTDGDGVPDVLERERGTDPYNADSDQDGVSDALDAFPLDPSRWQGFVVDPNDITPPVITVTAPVNARRIR